MMAIAFPGRGAVTSATALSLSVLLLLGACTKGPANEKKPLELSTVSVTKPLYREVSDSFSAVGNVKASNEVTVISETSGKILSMSAAIGMKVAADSPLALVDADLRAAALLASEAAFNKAAKDAERAASLYREKLVSDADLEAARLGEAVAKSQYLVARKELANTTIRSPIGGTIADTFVTLGGQVLAPGSPVALVVDDSRLKVRVLLPARSAIRHRPGDRVAVSCELFPARSFVGVIGSISVKGDEAHSFPTEVLLLGDASRELRAGMSVRLDFDGAGKRVLLIPRAAILGSVSSPEVFVVVDGPDGRAAVRKAIVAGDEYGTDIELISGLAESDLVVTGGQSLLTDGQGVRVVEAGGKP